MDSNDAPFGLMHFDALDSAINMIYAKRNHFGGGEVVHWTVDVSFKYSYFTLTVKASRANSSLHAKRTEIEVIRSVSVEDLESAPNLLVDTLKAIANTIETTLSNH